MFDHGLSLLAPCMNKESIENFDVMEDRQVQSFFGSRSAYDNLKLIPKDKLPKLPKLDDSYKDVLFEGLYDVLESKHLDKIWEMISSRWSYYENFCDQR